MNEKTKIDEATHFLNEMKEKHGDKQVFAFTLSAFLSASRSALQYALDQAKLKSGGQAWFSSRMNNSSILLFLRDQRNQSIHERPVSPRATYSIPVSCNLAMGESVTVAVNRAGVEITTSRNDLPAETKSFPAAESDISVTYLFNNWSGTENVVSLCEQYLAEVIAFVQDGQAKGFVTA